MTILKTATVYSRKFKMVKSSDHVSGATQSFIGAAPTVKISKGPLAAFTAAAGTVTELDSTNAPGWFEIDFTTVDTAISGDFGVTATGTGCDATDWVDQIQGQVFTDVVLNANGRVMLASGVQQNQPLTIMFPMTIQGVPTPGLTVTGQRNFGSGFSGISGTITDLGSGDYKASLLAADTNSAAAIYRFTAPSADDRNIALQFDP